MALKLFDQLVTRYLTDNTVASAGMAAGGGQGAGEYKSSDTYAPGDNRAVFGNPDIIIDHYQEIIDSTMQDSITRDKKLSIGKFVPVKINVSVVFAPLGSLTVNSMLCSPSTNKRSKCCP